jgi:hypothetical protein
MDPISLHLRETIDRALPMLEAIPEDRSGLRPAPGKWSPKEIIGHLIDSASNNHQRFVRAQFQDDLVFTGYEQDAWVALQQYQQAPWRELVALWHRFNAHLARVIDAAPEQEKTRPRHPHNLDRLAWRPVPADRPATLAYFMDDYVGHLKHHLRQILPGEF